MLEGVFKYEQNIEDPESITVQAKETKTGMTIEILEAHGLEFPHYQKFTTVVENTLGRDIKVGQVFRWKKGHGLDILDDDCFRIYKTGLALVFFRVRQEEHGARLK